MTRVRTILYYVLDYLSDIFILIYALMTPQHAQDSLSSTLALPSTVYKYH